MVCTFTNQVGLVWINVIAPNGESYGVTANGFVQGANVCEALVDRVVITFNPGIGLYRELDFGGDGYYIFTPYNNEPGYAEVEMQYWIED